MHQIPATRQLAEFTGELGYDDLPPAIRELMPTFLIDVFRAAAVGRAMPWVPSAEKALLGLGGKPVSSLFFDDRKADPVRATYVNGVIAGSLDWDDSHAGAILHPGVVVWPAALAVGELTGANGRSLIAAAVAGYEVAIRIGMSIQLSHSIRGFQATSTCGAFGAAAAAAKLLGLKADGVCDALGLAASYASGISQFFVSGSDVKRLHAGKAAAQGVEAALLARAGLTGPADAIEGEQGFGRAVSDAFDAAVIVDGLGEKYPTEDVLLKVHAGTARLQAAVEAAEALAREGLMPEQIESVEIGVHPAAMGKLSWNEPVDQQQAQVSAPFAVAMALALTGQRPAPLVLGVEDFGTYVNDPDIRGLSARTVCVVDTEIAEATTRECIPARLTVHLKDGGTRQSKVMAPKGSAPNPIAPEEVAARFRMAAAASMSPQKIDVFLAKVQDLAELDTASALFVR